MGRPVISVGLPQQTYERRKRVPVKNENSEGFTTESDGYEEVELVAEIDPLALVAALGRRAWQSKNGISRLQGGAVTVRVVSRRAK